MDAHGHEIQTRRAVRLTTAERCSKSSGGSRGGPPLFLDQTEARKKIFFFGDRPTLGSFISNYDDFKTTIGLVIKTTAQHVRHDS